MQIKDNERFGNEMKDHTFLIIGLTALGLFLLALTYFAYLQILETVNIMQMKGWI